MRTIHGLVIIVLMSFLLSACTHEVALRDIESADYGQFPKNYKEVIEGHMYTKLFDPYSAMYRYIAGPAKGYAHVRGGINPPEFGYLVAVGINAKNRLGAYTGEQLYSFLFKNDTFWMLDTYTIKQFVTASTAPKITGVVLGVNTTPVTPPLASIFKLGQPRGLMVANVTQDSVAMRAGIKQSDVILKYGDKVVNDTAELQGALADTSPGTTVSITIWRQGNELVLSASF